MNYDAILENNEVLGIFTNLKKIQKIKNAQIVVLKNQLGLV